MTAAEYFKGKKIIVMGLVVLGNLRFSDVRSYTHSLPSSMGLQSNGVALQKFPQKVPPNFLPLLKPSPDVTKQDL